MSLLRHDLSEIIFRRLLALLPILVLGIIIAFFYQMILAAWPSITKFGFHFFISDQWDPVAEEFGALPFIFGTCLTSFLALAMAIPVGVGAAIYLAEYAPPKVSKTISIFVDLLAAIPSVIYGLWGIFVLVPIMRQDVQPFLKKFLGFLPFFQGPNYGVGYLAASIILAIIIVPFIISVTREVILAVPGVYREAAYALGATRWEAIASIVLNYGKVGIMGSIILALGRAIGETMAVTMIIGNKAAITASVLSPGYTLASVVANEFSEATSKVYLAALIEIGLVLLVVSIIVNAMARALIWSISRQDQVKRR